jgi:predicted nucleic acid-binding protein
MAYLLDSNIFIEAKNRYYGFDICPGFWDWLVASNQAARVFSIEKVGDELKAGSDELADWATTQSASFFVAPDALVIPALSQVSNWVSSAAYDPAAKNTFLQVADYFLVAHALAHGFTLVSHEKADGSKKRIKIPAACIALGIKCVTPFEMLRIEKAKFVLV